MFQEINDYRNLPRKKALTFEELRQVYDLTDWRVALLDERIPREYNQISSLSIFKALILPFLIKVSSERALVRELNERERLRVLCGFMPGEKMPGSRSFWHFRNRFSGVFSEGLIKILISMVLVNKRPNLNLPFVMPISEVERILDGQPFEFRLDEYRPPVEVWTTTGDLNEYYALVDDLKEKLRSAKDFYDWSMLAADFESNMKHRKTKLFNRLGLPIEVRTKLHSGEVIRFAIDAPEWWITPAQRTDTITTIGPSTFRPYFACNVIVTREINGNLNILLSKRKGSFGKEMYTLPGGKQQEGETLQECASRELGEETRLLLKKSRPVSMYITRYPGKPQVTSIGVLALEYEGEPCALEPNQHNKWEWFDITYLPSPLFGPTKIALDQYLENKYPILEWPDIESRANKNKGDVEQLSIDF